jgi:hypothetical protein
LHAGVPPGNRWRWRATVRYPRGAIHEIGGVRSIQPATGNSPRAAINARATARDPSSALPPSIHHAARLSSSWLKWASRTASGVSNCQGTAIRPRPSDQCREIQLAEAVQKPQSPS